VVPQPFDSLSVGDTFSTSLTFTETHLVLSGMLYADAVPLHTNEEFSRRTHFGGRIVPGPLTSGFAAVRLGMYFGGRAVVLLELTERYKDAVQIGDRVTAKWTIAELHPKPRLKGGIVILDGVCTNQKETVVLELRATCIVENLEENMS
jgi:3-hydroxybutyryl-CoA dehydratase